LEDLRHDDLDSALGMIHPGMPKTRETKDAESGTKKLTLTDGSPINEGSGAAQIV
jgi:hypothetical protein